MYELLWVLMFASILYWAIVFFWGFKKLKEIKRLNIVTGVLLLTVWLWLIWLLMQIDDAKTVWSNMYSTNIEVTECMDNAYWEELGKCIVEWLDEFSEQEDDLYNALY